MKTIEMKKNSLHNTIQLIVKRDYLVVFFTYPYMDSVLYYRLFRRTY